MHKSFNLTDRIMMSQVLCQIKVKLKLKDDFNNLLGLTLAPHW